MTYGAKNYKTMSIQTATPQQLLIMLYEGAIQNVKKAVAAIEARNIPEKGKYIGKAHDIISELNVSLNHEIGGDVTRELERLYDFMISQLLKANLETNAEPLKAVQKNLEVLLDGWKQAVTQFNKDAALNRKPSSQG